MSEWRLFPEGTIPEYTTPAWYAGRESAPHLEQPGHSERLLTTFGAIVDAHNLGAKNVIDLGSGDGGLLSVTSRELGLPCYGYDLQQTNVDAAVRRGASVSLLDVVATSEWEQQVEPNTCLVATEMLEHLVDPHAYVRRLADTGAGWLVASSPYAETPEQHYEFHTWAWDTQGYHDLLANNGWRPLTLRLAWVSQIVLAVRA